ncbi:MAG: hypothetical protein U9O94_05185 [Nanoarchaeota archaeon]|nr:hypothetical protein [Nanoarchaeota archaeon]
MKLSNVVDDSGLVQKMNNICGTTNVIFSNKAKVSNINDALDRYFFLASQSNSSGSIDDSNRAASPIETQNIVSGTNYYKFSDFTNEILDVLQLGILDDAAEETTLTHETLENIGNFGDYYDTSDTGTPTHWIRLGDFIYLRPCPNYSETGGLRAYVGRIPERYAFTSFTVTIASPGVFSATAHGLSKGDALILETDGALPTGLTADTVVYYVITAGYTADAFQVSTTNSLTGTAVNTSGSQSGNHTFLKVSKSPGIPSIHHLYLARYASLPYLIEKNLPQKNSIAALIQEDERSIIKYFSYRDKDTRSRIINRGVSFR